MSMRYKGGVLSATGATSTTSAATGVWTLRQQMRAQAASAWPVPLAPGQQAYTTAGTYTWIAPAGVTSVSVVAVGGGGGGGGRFVCGCVYAGGGAGGGALGYKNGYSVTSGSSYTVVVGARGNGGSCGVNGTNGQTSYFVSTGVVSGGGGLRGFNVGAPGCGGTYTGTGGGNGGYGGQSSCTSNRSGGGGGAGGYSGVGGTGANANSGACGQNGAGGGGGGGGRLTSVGASGGGGGGGGVGLLGQGSNGVGGTNGAGGGGGSGGGAGGTICASTFCGGIGGTYGGGGGGASRATGSGYGGPGQVGAVRIIWPGTTRSFPSTNTGNL